MKKYEIGQRVFEAENIIALNNIANEMAIANKIKLLKLADMNVTTIRKEAQKLLEECYEN